MQFFLCHHHEDFNEITWKEIYTEEKELLSSVSTVAVTSKGPRFPI
jgi:hypothetical protein